MRTGLQVEKPTQLILVWFIKSFEALVILHRLPRDVRWMVQW